LELMSSGQDRHSTQGRAKIKPGSTVTKVAMVLEGPMREGCLN
jgi:hypothetical protein